MASSWREKGLERTELPNWLTVGENIPLASENIGRQHHYVQKALDSIAHFIEQSIFSEKYATKKGLLQGIDPRVKVISLFSLLIAINLLQNIYAILEIYAIILFLAYLSKIDLAFFLKRVWVFIPVFAGIIALPAIFNIFTPGDPLVTFVRFNQEQQFWGFTYSEISITKQGVFGALLFTFRVATSVSLVILLTLTTQWVTILKALRVLGVPQALVLVLSMTYQYVILLSRLIQDMHIAKKARTIPHPKIHNEAEQERTWVASRIGTVFRKSYAMIDDVHGAMLARGFTGDVQVIQPFTFHWRDFGWILVMSGILMAIIWLNIF